MAEEVANKLRLLRRGSVVDPQARATATNGESRGNSSIASRNPNGRISGSHQRHLSGLQPPESVTAPRPKHWHWSHRQRPDRNRLFGYVQLGIQRLATRPLQKSDASNVKSLQQQPAFAVEPKHKTNKKSGRMLYLVPGIHLMLLGQDLRGLNVSSRSGSDRSEMPSLSSIEEALKKKTGPAASAWPRYSLAIPSRCDTSESPPVFNLTKHARNSWRRVALRHSSSLPVEETWTA